MKKTFGRILATILVMALVIGLLPTTFAATLAPSGVKVVYDLVYEGAVNDSSIEGVKMDDTNGMWEFGGKHANAATITSNLKGHGTNAFLAVNQWWAVTVYVEKEGWYDLSIKHSVGSASGTAGVYFGDATSTPAEIMAAGEPVKSVSFYENKSTSAGTVSPIGTVKVSAPGKYTVVFKAEANGEGGRSRQYIKEIILDGTNVVVPEDGEDEGIKIVYNMITDKVSGGSWVDVVEFGDTNGFWAFETAYKEFSNSAFVQENSSGHGVEAAYGLNAWWAIRVYIPMSGSYTLKLNHIRYGNGGTTNVYFGTPEEGAAEIVKKDPVGEVCFYSATQTTAEDDTVGTIDVATPGEYILVFKSAKVGDGNGNGTKNRQIFKQVIIENGEGSVPMIDITSSAEEIAVGETATVSATSALMSDGEATSNVKIAYSVKASDASVAEVSANGVVTGLSEGTAEIIATATQGEDSYERTINIKVTAPVPAEPGEEVSDTLVNFTFVVSDATAGSVSAAGYPAVGEVAIGTSVEATATANEGYEFAYWRNGAGTVLSTEKTETFKFNTNTAVYAEFIKLPDADATEVPIYFYNGNGTLLESKNVEKGTAFGSSKIANPSLTGFAFAGWSVDDNAIINALTRAVALYDDSDEKFTVTADGAVITSDATYGSEVTVTSNNPDFKAWKLGDKIVSYNKSYTFYVWGNVTLTSATKGEAAPVAALTTVEGKPMLIYSAPADCEILEAGILFGNSATIGSYDSKAFAKESTGQFTAEPNGAEDDKTARGYLIFKKDNVIRVIYAD